MSSYSRNSKSAKKVRAKLGLPPRTENPAAAPRYPEGAYPSSPMPAQPAEIVRSDPHERLRRSMAAMGNQATQGVVEAPGATPTRPSMPVERVVSAPTMAEWAGRQLHLHDVLAPGNFTLESLKVGDDIKIWAKLADGMVENVTDRFFPQRREDGIIPPADIIRRRPSDNNNDEAFDIRGVKPARNPDGQEELKLLLEGGRGMRRNITLDEINQTKTDGLGSYWDVQPPIPYVELSRIDGPVAPVAVPLTQPPRPTT